MKLSVFEEPLPCNVLYVSCILKVKIEADFRHFNLAFILRTQTKFILSWLKRENTC
jgi:hypothetical protein